MNLAIVNRSSKKGVDKVSAVIRVRIIKAKRHKRASMKAVSRASSSSSLLYKVEGEIYGRAESLIRPNSDRGFSKPPELESRNFD